MKPLTLADLEGMNTKELREHFMSEYSATKKEVDRFSILIAYESVGDWGCDSSSWFLLKEKKTGKLYEVNGSHCS